MDIACLSLPVEPENLMPIMPYTDTQLQWPLGERTWKGMLKKSIGKLQKGQKLYSIRNQFRH